MGIITPKVSAGAGTAISIENSAVSKPPAYVVYGVIQVFLFSPGDVVVEDVQLHRRGLADRVNPSDGQRPDRFQPGVTRPEQIKSRTCDLVGALGRIDQRCLPLTPAQVLIPDRYLHSLGLNLIDPEAMAYVLGQLQQYQPDLIIALEVAGTSDAVAHALDWRNIPAGHDLSAVRTVGKLVQHDAVLAELLTNQARVGVGQVANGLAAQQGQLPRCGGSHI